VANLVDNALLHGAGKAVRVEAGRVADWVDLRVIDHGPGIRPADRDLVFLPSNASVTPTTAPGRSRPGRLARFRRGRGRPAGPRGHPGGGCTLVVRLPVPVDRTPTIIDADLESDVVVPDRPGDGGPDEGQDRGDAPTDDAGVHP